MDMQNEAVLPSEEDSDISRDGVRKTIWVGKVVACSSRMSWIRQFRPDSIPSCRAHVL
jgi:hypothetical protein